MLVDDNQGSHAAILQRILNSERVKATFSTINRNIKSQHRHPMNSLKVPSGEQYIQVHDAERINTLILQHTQSVYQKFNELPITDVMYQQYVGLYGENAGARDIAEGHPHTNMLPPCQYASNYLKQLTQLTAEPIISAEVTGQQVQNLFRKQENLPNHLHLEDTSGITKPWVTMMICVN